MKVSRVVVTVAALVFLFLAWLWFLSDQIRQMQVMFTYGACLLLGITAFAWLAFTKQLPPLRRLVLASSIIGLIALFFGLVRFRGVTGDWIPVVEWRWAKGVDWASRQTSSARLSSTSCSRGTTSSGSRSERWGAARGGSASWRRTGIGSEIRSPSCRERGS